MEAKTGEGESGGVGCFGRYGRQELLDLNDGRGPTREVRYRLLRDGLFRPRRDRIKCGIWRREVWEKFGAVKRDIEWNLDSEGWENKEFKGSKDTKRDRVSESASGEIDKVRFASWNVGSLNGKAEEVTRTMSNWNVDVGCLQEVRWKASGARVLKVDDEVDSYKFFWQGGENGLAGVGVMVKLSWAENVIKVRRVNERTLLIKLAIGKKMINIVSAYAPQVGRCTEEKDRFWWELTELVTSVNKGEELVIGGDLNGHVGNSKDGYDEVHGGFGYGSKNEEGERILDFCEATEMRIVNTWFQKEETKMVTYESGEYKSTIDYILARKGDWMTAIDIEAVYVGMQHKLLIGDFMVEGSVEGGKRKEIYIPKLRTWKLKKEEFRQRYIEKVKNKWDGEKDDADNRDVNGRWEKLKRVLTSAAEDVCGWSKRKQGHRRTMKWSEVVQKAWQEKWRWEMVYNMTGTEKAKRAYKEAQKKARMLAKRECYRKMEEETKDLESDEGKRKVFRLARRLKRENQDIAGSNCLKNNNIMVVDEGEKLKIWKEYFEKLLNEENKWDGKTEWVNANNKEDDKEKHQIHRDEVEDALRKMKVDKAAGPSGIVTEMIKAAESIGVDGLTDLCNVIVSEGHIPEDWKSSLLIPVYKGKGDPMDCGSYRAIKLLEHSMKVVERVLEQRIRKMVKVNEMQCGFMPRKGTTDAIFIVRQVQEKYRAKGKRLYYAFVDLEKAYDRVPREVTRWAMRMLGVEEWLVSAVMAMYEEAWTVVRTKEGDSERFEVKVGLHQGSVLSPLLFVIVMEAVTRNVRGGLPWELLYADDLVLMAESLEELMEKLRKWKGAMEGKGLKVNMKKTKVMLGEVRGQIQNTGKYPCTVCRKGVGGNSIQCTVCKGWVHKRCSGIKGKLPANGKDFECRKCQDRNQGGRREVVEGQIERVEIEVGEELEVVKRFCYLGDVIEAGGGVEAAITVRMRCAWKKFWELEHILMMKGLSLRFKGKVYSACVRSVMMYGSETWAVKVENVQRMERTEMQMVRLMCGVKLRERFRNEELRGWMGIEQLGSVIRRGRLRWFGHVERRDEEDWLKKCMKMDVGGVRPVGRPRKTWEEVVKEDMKEWGLSREMAQERGIWRKALRHHGNEL